MGKAEGGGQARGDKSNKSTAWKIGQRGMNATKAAKNRQERGETNGGKEPPREREKRAEGELGRQQKTIVKSRKQKTAQDRHRGKERRERKGEPERPTRSAEGKGGSSGVDKFPSRTRRRGRPAGEGKRKGILKVSGQTGRGKTKKGRFETWKTGSWDRGAGSHSCKRGFTKQGT